MNSSGSILDLSQKAKKGYISKQYIQFSNVYMPALEPELFWNSE